MNFFTLFLIAVILLLLYVFLRHQGDWRGAGIEVVETAGRLWERYLGPVLYWFFVTVIWNHKRVAIPVIIVVLVVLCIALILLWPVLFPPQEVLSLSPGENVLTDACGNKYTAWVVERESGMDRIEITKKDLSYGTLTILAPGADPAKCTIQYPLTYEEDSTDASASENSSK